MRQELLSLDRAVQGLALELTIRVRLGCLAGVYGCGWGALLVQKHMGSVLAFSWCAGSCCSGILLSQACLSRHLPPPQLAYRPAATPIPLRSMLAAERAFLAVPYSAAAAIGHSRRGMLQLHTVLPSSFHSLACPPGHACGDTATASAMPSSRHPPSLHPTHAHLPQRNLFLASDAEARFVRTQRRLLSGSKAGGKDGPRERPARAEDVVRLYDTLIANGEGAGGTTAAARTGRTALLV